MTAEDMYEVARREGKEDIVMFMDDMLKVGLRTMHYEGRYWWKGPAVAVASVEDALSHTRVPCQWDQLGEGWVVYPKESL